MSVMQTKLPVFTEESVLAQIKELVSESGPLELEIGCGKGKFIVTQAKFNPQIRFIAIDRVKKWMNVGVRRAGNLKIPNLFFFKAEAREVLRDTVPFGRLQAIHINFPDPWPKRRHRKRRLVTATLLTELHARLMPGGALYFATDDLDYFQTVKKDLSRLALNWKKEETVNRRLTGDQSIPTNYEAKFAAAGKDLYYLKLTKS